MKRKTVLLFLCLIVLLSATAGIVACKVEHKHAFTEQNVDEAYLASPATCTSSATYYYSCACGEKGTATFASGNALNHSFTNYVSDGNATCTADGTKTAKCDRDGCNATDTVADEGSVIPHADGAITYKMQYGSDAFSAKIEETVYRKLCTAVIATNDYNITLPTKTFSYDGQKHSLTFEGDALPERITPIFNGNDQTAAGDYTVTAGFVDNETQTVFTVVLESELKVNKDGKYHEVVFAFDDAEKDNISVAVKHGEKISEAQYPQLPEKKGYTVKWLYDDSEVTDDVTISILYTPIVYKINYVLDGAENNPRNPDTYTIESSTITLYEPQNAMGLSFQGWYSSPNYELSSRISTIASGSTGDLTFYAKFLKYKVEAADGFTFDYKSYDYPALTQTVSSTKSTILLSTTIQVSSGCTWTLSRDIEGADVIKTKNMPLTEGHNIAYITVWYGDDLNLVYYLDIYKLGHRNYSFVADGVTVFPQTTVEEQSYVSAPAAPEKPGYTFTGWYAYSSFTVGGKEFPISIPDRPAKFPYCLNKDTAFLAIFKPNVYTATYDVNGGKPLAYDTENITFDKAFTPVEPQRDGYTFVGWQDSEGNVFKSLSQWKYLSSQTFIAQWQLNTYSIDYDLDGGTNPEEAVYEYTILSETITLLNPSKVGYDFSGWFADADFGEQVTEIVSGSFVDKKFYAKWTPVVYGITYVLNGGTNSDDNPTTYTIEDEDIVLIAPTKLGYIGSWSEGDKIPKGSTENKTFTAEYTPDVYLSNDGSTITGLRNTSIKDLVIFSEYNGIPVSQIGDGAFKNCSGLKSIDMPNSVTSIGSYAFYGCSSLTSIEIPDTVTSISDYAFAYCRGLTSIIIPDSVTSISSSAFSGCSGLTSITLPFVGGSRKTSSDTYQYPFGYIFGTSSYDGGVATKQYYYVSSTTSTTYVTYYIPSSLKSVTITGGNILYGAFYNCSGLTSIEIPDSVTSIGSFAFSGCSGLTSITIPDSVTSIGELAFDGCSGLKYNEYDNALYLGNKSNPYVALITAKTTDITSCYINEKCKVIYFSAFSGCSGLESITLPFVGGSRKTSSDTYQYPFGYIFGTSSYTGGVATEQHYYGSSTSYTTGNTYYIPKFLKSVTITGGNILYGAFYGCSGLTSIIIPDSVTSIGSSAFEGCSGLKYNEYGNALYLGNNSNPYVVLIKAKTTDITRCNINEKCKVIYSYAFSGCSGLTSVTIPDSVTSIGSSAFSGCSKLENIYITDIAAWCKISGIGNLMGYGSSNKKLYFNNELLTDLVIPDSVTSIGSWAFYDCSGLTRVTIGSGITSIGYKAFYNCSGLTSITIGNGVTSIDNYAFSGCSKLENIYITDIAAWCKISGIGNLMSYGSSNKKLYLNNELLTDLVIPDSVTSIGSSAFRGCSDLTRVTIGSGITSIGYKAFYNCSGLTSVTIGNSVTSIDNYAFSGCSGLTSVTIGNSVTSIGDYAFYSCTGLTNIYYTGDIAAWCKIFGKGNLMGYGSSNKKLYLNNELLTNLVIPDSVTSIGWGAFYGCSGLTSVTIPSSVTSIWEWAFFGCIKLVEVVNNSSLSLTKGSSSNGYVAYYALNVKKGGSSEVVNQDGYLFYTYNKVNYLLGYVGTETELTLPENYNGQNYKIYKYAFV